MTNDTPNRETEALFSGADPDHLEAGRGGRAGGKLIRQGRYLGADLLSLEKTLRRLEVD